MAGYLTQRLLGTTGYSGPGDAVGNLAQSLSAARQRLSGIPGYQPNSGYKIGTPMTNLVTPSTLPRNVTQPTRQLQFAQAPYMNTLQSFLRTLTGNGGGGGPIPGPSPYTPGQANTGSTPVPPTGSNAPGPIAPPLNGPPPLPVGTGTFPSSGNKVPLVAGPPIPPGGDRGSITPPGGTGTGNNNFYNYPGSNMGNTTGPVNTETLTGDDRLYLQRMMEVPGGASGLVGSMLKGSPDDVRAALTTLPGQDDPYNVAQKVSTYDPSTYNGQLKPLFDKYFAANPNSAYTQGYNSTVTPQAGMDLNTPAGQDAAQKAQASYWQGPQGQALMQKYNQSQGR